LALKRRKVLKHRTAVRVNDGCSLHGIRPQVLVVPGRIASVPVLDGPPLFLELVLGAHVVQSAVGEDFLNPIVPLHLRPRPVTVLVYSANLAEQAHGKATFAHIDTQSARKTIEVLPIG